MSVVCSSLVLLFVFAFELFVGNTVCVKCGKRQASSIEILLELVRAFPIMA